MTMPAVPPVDSHQSVRDRIIWLALPISWGAVPFWFWLVAYGIVNAPFIAFFVWHNAIAQGARDWQIYQEAARGFGRGHRHREQRWWA
jgi:hypothetical protein